MVGTMETLIIDGARVKASDEGTFDVYDPSSGEVLATVAKSTTSDVGRAVQAARAALESKAWGGMAPVERGRIMIRIAQTLRDRAEELATLESRDNGKPLRQSRIDVQVAARYFEFFAGIADKIMGNTIPLGPGYLDYTIREPIGVSAQIVPWNYPIQIGARGVAPALAAGCTVVLKPSSEAPMTALRLGEIGLACGLPAGVLNVVPGTGSEAGSALASHPDINQLTFTGSVDVGISVAKMAAENVVPVVMELGGKSPNIVFADADLDLAVQGVATAIFQNAGQTCSAGSRLLVERQAHEALVEAGARSAVDCAAVAAESDIVFTMLPDSAIVADVVSGVDGVLAHLAEGGVIVEMSTIDPLITDRLAAAAEAKGCAFVDAPVGRLASHAARGESLFMVGATDEAFARVRPLLEAMGTTIHHCGGVGTGIRTKLVNNYLAIVSCAFNAEALALSQRFGLSLEKTLDVIHGTTATNGQLKIAWPTKVLRGDTEPGFTIDLAHKDLTLIVQAANGASVPVPIAAAARESFSTARAQGQGAKDFSAMVDVLCDLVQVTRPRLQ